MRVLVCGGRWYSNKPLIEKVLNSLTNVTLLIHGACKRWDKEKNEYVGADHLSGEWAKRNNVPVDEYPADWEKHGRSAGFIRNKQMLKESKPDVLVTFPGGHGTAMMVKLAKEAGVRIIDINNVKPSSNES